MMAALHTCPSCGTRVPSPLLPNGQSGSAIGDLNSNSREEAPHVSEPSIAANGPAAAPENQVQTDKSTKNPPSRIGRWIQRDGQKVLVDTADLGETFGSSQANSFVATIREERTRIGGVLRDEMGPSTQDVMSIISPSLQDLVRRAVKFFPGIGLDASEVAFPKPYAPLYFYISDLRDSTKGDPDDPASQDLEAFLRFYEKEIQPEHDEIKRMVQQNNVRFEHLWALFRPGDILYGTDEFGEPRLHMLVACSYRDADNYVGPEEPYSIRRFRRLAVDTWSITWDHTTNLFQRRTSTRSIRAFTGSCPVSSLPLYPLAFYQNGNDIEELLRKLEKRGNYWKDLVSNRPSCHLYDGRGEDQIKNENKRLEERVVVDGSASIWTFVEEQELRKQTRTRMNLWGGVMSRLSQNRFVEEEVPIVPAALNDSYSQFDDFDPKKEFGAVQAQLCPATAWCYAIKSRSWFSISIANLLPVDWATEAFEHLVLEDWKKTMVHGLVQQHRKYKDQTLGDVIPSKGRGLVFVLHGPPGVGKTLTAETIAEHTQKPLYPINIGELTAESEIVQRLQTVFDRAARWDAVLLLDEADVLLEKRSYEDLRRNGIVSVFLRMLEYYEGILFLTTNRVETMDVAFQSRIHVAIKYEPLSSPVRRQIWQNFINRLDDKELKAKKELQEALDDLQEWPLNGRQIRNVLSIAESSALGNERRRGALRYEHVEEVANQTIDFQTFFEDAAREKKGFVGKLSTRQFQEKKRVLG